MTKLWHDQQWMDSIAEAKKYEFRRVCGADPTYHPHDTGAIYHEPDFSIDQHWGPILITELRPIYDTRAARRWENQIHYSTAAAPYGEILEGPHPYLKITDDRCRRHATFNDRTLKWEIAGIYDLNRGGCGSMIYVTTGFEIYEVPCCPEELWPPDSYIVPREWIMRLRAEGASHVHPSHGTHPDQLSIFDEIPDPISQYKRTVDTGDASDDDAQSQNNEA